MTIPVILDTLADFLREEVKNFTSEVPKDKERRPIEVYSGYPPVRVMADPKTSFICCLADEFTNNEDGGTVSVMVSFSIYSPDEYDEARLLYDIVEHCRQAVLRNRIIDGKASLVLPLKGDFAINQPNTQYQAAMTVKYSITDTYFEGNDFDCYK